MRSRDIRVVINPLPKRIVTCEFTHDTFDGLRRATVIVSRITKERGFSQVAWSCPWSLVVIQLASQCFQLLMRSTHDSSSVPCPLRPGLRDVGTRPGCRNVSPTILSITNPRCHSFAPSTSSGEVCVPAHGDGQLQQSGCCNETTDSRSLSGIDHLVVRSSSEVASAILNSKMHWSGSPTSVIRAPLSRRRSKRIRASMHL